MSQSPPHGITERIVLASASPRRRELLRQAGVDFEAIPADLDESAISGDGPRDTAERTALAKTLFIAKRASGRIVLGADTIVVVDGDVLGKPADADDAVAMLDRIIGRSHEVMTGVALVDRDEHKPRSFVVTSRVHMRAAHEAELRSYVETGESLDKAGAYAVQGEGRRFIESIEGSETNVIGLPMDETLALLREVGAL